MILVAISSAVRMYYHRRGVYRSDLGVCAVEIPVAKKWHGEDSFLFF
jgi:hypothetical protein